MSTTETEFRLDPSEAELLSRQAEAFARALPDPSAQVRYARVAAEAANGRIPEDLIGAVEAMLELFFDSGRVANRAVMQSVFGRTPRGRALSKSAREVSRALASLRGQVIADVRLSSVGPSRHTFVVETDRCRLTLEFDRDGARVTALETG